MNDDEGITTREQILREGLLTVAERCETFAAQAMRGMPFHKLPKQPCEAVCENHEEIRWLLGFASIARSAVRRADRMAG